MIRYEMFCMENQHISIWIRFGFGVNWCRVYCLFTFVIVYAFPPKFMYHFVLFHWFFRSIFFLSWCVNKKVALIWIRYFPFSSLTQANALVRAVAFFHRKSTGRSLASNAIWSCAHFDGKKKKKFGLFVKIQSLFVPHVELNWPR